MKANFYIWQDEVEDLRASIRMTKDIIESKRYRGEDVSAELDDILQMEREINEITERNTNNNW